MSDANPPASGEQILPASVLRNLPDRIYEKRKVAAQEIESLVREMGEQENLKGIQAVLRTLITQFICSQQPNYRKGGLIGLANAAIGLGPKRIGTFLPHMFSPVLKALTDTDNHVRFFACESLYNICKVARSASLPFFTEAFDAMCVLYADQDTSVQSAVELLDRLWKDIVTEQSPQLKIGPLVEILKNRIYVLDARVRSFLLSWILVLNSLAGIELLQYLPHFLDGIFVILNDAEHKDVRTLADGTLQDFLSEILEGKQRFDFVRLIRIPISHCSCNDTFTQSRALLWISQFVSIGEDAMLPFVAAVLSHIITMLHAQHDTVRALANDIHQRLLAYVQNTSATFDVEPILRVCADRLQPSRTGALGVALENEGGVLKNATSASVATARTEHGSSSSSSPRILPTTATTTRNAPSPPLSPGSSEPPPQEQSQLTDGNAEASSKASSIEQSSTLPTTTATATATATTSSTTSSSNVATPTATTNPDTASATNSATASNDVPKIGGTLTDSSKTAPSPRLSLNPHRTVPSPISDPACRHAALQWIHMLFLHMPEKVFARMEYIFPALMNCVTDSESSIVRFSLLVLARISGHGIYFSLFVTSLLKLFKQSKVLLQKRASLILRTIFTDLDPERVYRALASKLDTEVSLTFTEKMVKALSMILLTAPEASDIRASLKSLETTSSRDLFIQLYRPWCHAPVSALALCLLAGAYEHAAQLVQHIARDDSIMNAEVLVEIDKLVQLFESPVFVHVRVHLVEPAKYPFLIQAMYGLLQILPQSDAFHMLNNRLLCVQTLAAVRSMPQPKVKKSSSSSSSSSSSFSNNSELDVDNLIRHFLKIQALHAQHRNSQRIGQDLPKGLAESRQKDKINIGK